MKSKESIGLKGIITIEHFGSNGEKKKIFAPNKLWRLIRGAVGIDFRIIGITGSYVSTFKFSNTITDTGLAVCSKRLGEISETGITHMALGIGSPDTNELGSEITDGGGERASVTPTSTTNSVTDDTVTSTNTFSFTGTYAVTEEGLFNDASAGDMIASQSFSAINVISGDSITVTHDIVIGTA